MAAPPIIIIADPDTMISNALRVAFSSYDCAVLLAASNREVEDFAAQTVVQMIVLDVSQLKLSGYAACARIRHRHGYARRPIVLTAAAISTMDTAAAEQAGATVLLSKPYSVNSLVRAVDPYLAADDPLRGHLPPVNHAAQVDWTKEPNPTWRFGPNSGLSRNSQVLPIVRGKGVRIPLFKVS
jgi:DNA-binding response OmpR family regulator